MFFFFFFQAEDGIRDLIVTGVQTCALPIFGVDRIERVLEARRGEHHRPFVFGAGREGEEESADRHRGNQRTKQLSSRRKSHDVHPDYVPWKLDRSSRPALVLCPAALSLSRASRTGGSMPSPPASMYAKIASRMRGSQNFLMWLAIPGTTSSARCASKNLPIWFAI